MTQKWALGPRALLAGAQAKSHPGTWGSLMASRHKLQGEAVTVTVEGLYYQLRGCRPH